MRTEVWKGDESEKNEIEWREEKVEAEMLEKEAGTSQGSNKLPVIGLISKAGKSFYSITRTHTRTAPRLRLMAVVAAAASLEASQDAVAYIYRVRDLLPPTALPACLHSPPEL